MCKPKVLKWEDVAEMRQSGVWNEGCEFVGVWKEGRSYILKSGNNYICISHAGISRMNDELVIGGYTRE